MCVRVHARVCIHRSYIYRSCVPYLAFLSVTGMYVCVCVCMYVCVCVCVSGD